MPSAPIIFDVTPVGGYLVPVTADAGGFAGLQLLSQSGPSATVEISTDGQTYRAVTFPYTLAAGETLRLTRTDTSNTLSMLCAVMPTETGAGAAGLALTRDTDGYLTTDQTLSRDADGYLTTDQPLSRDADGYLSDGATP